MSLSTTVTDRLFAALFNIYGSQWLHQWKDNDINEVKSFWSDQLGFFANHLDSIAWALDHLPDRAPNLVQFKKLCMEAPKHSAVEALEWKAASPIPPAIAEELKKIAQTTSQDPKAWAKRILKRVENGEKPSNISVRFAKEALLIRD
jgi:hypothetical protein